jgi:hypothetical protein
VAHDLNVFPISIQGDVMRRLMQVVVVSCIPALPLPLAAQFEGTINLKVPAMAGSGDADLTMKIAIKGDKQVSIMQMPASAGPMAGMEVRTVLDAKSNTATVLMPLPPGLAAMGGMGNAKGIKSVTDLSDITIDLGAGGQKSETKKLGTKQKIAGLDCDDYEINQPNAPPVRACISQALGRFVFPQAGGGMVGRAVSPPGWAKAFGNDPGFPLKVWNTDGSVAMEITAITKGPVSATLFEIPDGYMDMSGMMRGRGRP